ncbi:hypothetical protein [Amphibacillus sediminis]|uniref:hypothetical protein n=1 Tax=Amphibacillus sediminis TaxID=360185 RepID=UPI0008352E65|nr:hypothetical protein [Amphibacillus sediminis]
MKVEQLNPLRQETAIKNFRFNRFLLLRYLLAVFFFINLYWFLALVMSRSVMMLLPLSLLVICTGAVMEHVKLYGEKSNHLDKHLHINFTYHCIQVVVNVGLGLTSMTGLAHTHVYPFLADSVQLRLTLAAILVIGIIMSLICIKRIRAIQRQADKHFQYMQEFEKILK